jgi:exopolysaccharide biosynthesis polyprenyl glycosylphosphotransferase
MESTITASASGPQKSWRSFRGALDHWDGTRLDGQVSRKAPLPPHIWQALWLLADIIIWLAAAAVCLGVMMIFSKSSVLKQPGVVAFPLGTSLLAGWFVGAYSKDTDFASLRFASELLIAGVIAAFIGPALAVFFSTYGQGVQTSRLLLFLTPCLGTVGWLFARRLWWARSAHGYDDLRIIVLGTEAEAGRLQHALSMTERPLRVAHLDAAEARDGELEAMLRTPLSSLNPQDHHCGQDTIVIAPSAANSVNQLSPFLVSLHSSSVPVYTWSAFWSQRIKTLDWESDSPEWFFEQNFRHAQHSAFSQLKRAGDVMVSSVALLLCLPVMLLTAILIRLDSPGAAFFKQQRVGLRGEEFTIYKFRTMTLGAEKSGTTTTVNDARITRLGQILRKYRIDEIPQLINVLKGDMSVVGPRPEWTKCVADYEQHLPCYHLRHLAKPGITGWAQVNYPYGQDVDDARNKLSFDLYYVANSSFMLDCSILLKTIYVLAGHVGGR